MSKQVLLILVFWIALVSIPFATGQNCNAVNDCQTGQQCRYVGMAQQCVWTCDGTAKCPQSGNCVSAICLYGPNNASTIPIPINNTTTSAAEPTPTSNITSSTISAEQNTSTTSPDVTPSVISVPYATKVTDKAFQTTFIILAVGIGLSAILFSLWYWKRKQQRIHRFQTLISTPRSSIIVPSGTTARGLEEPSEYLDIPQMTHQRTPLDEVNARLSGSEVIDYQYGGDAGSGQALPVPEQTIYGSNAASTSSIDLSVEPAQRQEPYKDV